MGRFSFAGTINCRIYQLSCSVRTSCCFVMAYIGGSDSSLYKQLWRESAGSLATIPGKGELVYYFPQGHMEQELGAALNQDLEQELVPHDLPSKILCQVLNVVLGAEPHTNQNPVYAAVTLIPMADQGESTISRNPQLELEQCRFRSFRKILSASDISNHGSLIIKRKHAEECLPPLENNQNPPRQELVAVDLQGKEWRFQHSFRGSPERHLLQGEWSAFVNSKNLAKGDMVIFLRGENGELMIGVRKSIGEEPNESLMLKRQHCSWALATVCQAIMSGTMFVVFYRPGTTRSEFMVNVNKYFEAQKHNLSIGMRFMMRFEGEELQEQRFNGRIVHLDNTISTKWPDSEWRSVKVQWDQPSRTFLPERVSPWELELPLNSQPRKRKRAQVGSIEETTARQNQTVMTEVNKSVFCSNKRRECSYIYNGRFGGHRIASVGERCGAAKEDDIEVNINSIANVDERCGAEKEGEIEVNINGVNGGHGKDDGDSNLRGKSILGEGNEQSDGIDLINNYMLDDAVGNNEYSIRENCDPSHNERTAVVNDPHNSLCVSSHQQIITSPSTETLLLPSVELHHGSIAVLSSECPAPSTSKGDISETYSSMHCLDNLYEDFHGFKVHRDNVPYLQRIWSIEGNFWENSMFHLSLRTVILDKLGFALAMKDRTWKSLSTSELETLIHSIEDAVNAGFKLGCLGPILQQAKAVLNSYSTRQVLEVLEMEKNSLEAQLQNVLIQSQTFSHELSMKTSGLDFDSKCFGSVFC